MGKSRILILPDLIPFPPTDGGKLCVFGFVDYLRSHHEIHLLLSCSFPEDTFALNSLRACWPEVQIHEVRLYQTREKRSLLVKASELAIRLLKKTTRVLENNQSNDQEENDWCNVNRSTPFFPHSSQFISKLESLLTSHKFDIIQTEFTRMLNLVHFFPPEAKKIFVQIEERSGVLKDFGESHSIPSAFLKHVVGNTEFLEFGYMARYDYIFALSESDKKRIIEKIPGARVYVSPYGLLDKDLTHTPDFDNYSPENLIFIGSEFHYPNWDAVNWFLTHVVKKIDLNLFKKFYITGRWTEGTIKNFETLDSRVEFIGFVEDLSPFLNKSISIVPIRIGGGGIRTKILTAMANGTAVVTTSLAAIGINGHDQKELLIADSAENFVEAIQELFGNPERTKATIRNAHDLVKREYSQSSVGEIRNQIYREILEK